MSIEPKTREHARESQENTIKQRKPSTRKSAMEKEINTTRFSSQRKMSSSVKKQSIVSRESRPSRIPQRKSEEGSKNEDKKANEKQAATRKIPNPDYITKKVEERYLKPGDNISSEKLGILMRDSRDSIGRKKFEDNVDHSNTPSYSNVTCPYQRVCLRRYQESKKRYNEQFMKEMQQHIDRQPNAFESLSLQRSLAITSLWPPLHNTRDIDNTHLKIFALTPKEKKRLAYIMRVDWSKTQ